MSDASCFDDRLTGCHWRRDDVDKDSRRSQTTEGACDYLGHEFVVGSIFMPLREERKSSDVGASIDNARYYCRLRGHRWWIAGLCLAVIGAVKYL